MKWLGFYLLAVVLITLTIADGEIWEEDDHEVLIRSERGAKTRGKPHLEITIFNPCLLSLSALCYNHQLCLEN
ncbi:hypothetical protein BDFB_011515 [Asbolus verrucosus]|uniref:Uncharacterized protein n=1 Tax=Asbolus verrucosus TaxID=1661398 RepID=A0A482VFP0_ASBVE|nr:hypothetical protein BDFB_011515 [Asbolus verrucosus]